MTRRWKKGTVVGLLASGVFIATSAESCDANNEPYQDAPRTGVVNKDPADIIEMPDGFSNLATKCDHGFRIYVPFKGTANRTAVTAVPDPTCK